MRRSVLWIIGFTVLLGGCALTPDYERPELKLSDEWFRTTDARESIANLSWWEIYDDAALLNLIETALAENQDLAVALARMQESRYLVTFTRADQFPFLDVFGEFSRSEHWFVCPECHLVIPGSAVCSRRLQRALAALAELERELLR